MIFDEGDVEAALCIWEHILGDDDYWNGIIQEAGTSEVRDFVINKLAKLCEIMHTRHSTDNIDVVENAMFDWEYVHAFCNTVQGWRLFSDGRVPATESEYEDFSSDLLIHLRALVNPAFTNPNPQTSYTEEDVL